MNTETFSEPADVAYNAFNLRIGNLVNGCNAIYNGEWGDINKMKRCLVAKIPASMFNLEKYKKVCALSDLYSDYIVQILYKIEGYEHVYVLFKHYNALQVVLQSQVPLAAKENIFNKLFFIVFQLFEKHPIFQELRVVPEYIRLDANLSPRLLFYPDVTTNETFSQRYANGNCIRIDLGVIGFYLAKQSLPLRNNKIHYNNHKIMFTSELSFLVDRLLTLEWSREACATYAKYIRGITQKAGQELLSAS
jgi:hypothetical protein